MKDIRKPHRFIIDQKITDQDEVTLTDYSLVHQIRDVLRLKAGDPIILLDGAGTMLHGRVKEVLKKESIISKEVLKKVSRDNEIKMNLFFSLIKKDKIEWVLQKCTELGVSEFHPIISERTEKTGFKMDRLKTIIKEAVEQSERCYLPALHEPVKLSEAVKNCKGNCYILNMDGERLSVSQIKQGEDVNVFIGPEGGWSPKDLELFDDKFKKISISKNVLRAETASVAAASIILQ